MIKFAGAVFAAATLTLGSAAWSASVVDIEGRVLANSGAGFKRLSGPVAVRPGTRVMANPGGSATIIYDNGCREQVMPGGVVTVRSEGPCSLAAAETGSVYALGAVAIGAGAAVAIGLSKSNDKPASP